MQVSSPSAPHPLDHGDHLVHVAILGLAPGRAHAEALRARGFRFRGRIQYGRDIHQLAGIQTRAVMRGLRAITAILRAAAGLHRQQGAELDLARRVPLTVHRLRAPHQFHERQVEQRGDLRARPVRPQGIGLLEIAGDGLDRGRVMQGH